LAWAYGFVVFFLGFRSAFASVLCQNPYVLSFLLEFRLPNARAVVRGDTSTDSKQIPPWLASSRDLLSLPFYLYA